MSLPERPWHNVMTIYAGEVLGREAMAEVDHRHGQKTPSWLGAEELRGQTDHPRGGGKAAPPKADSPGGGPDSTASFEPCLGRSGGSAGLATLAPAGRQSGTGAPYLRVPSLALGTLLFAAMIAWL